MSVAVIGCGYWGKNLVRNFKELGALAAICDMSEVAAKAMSAAHGVPARGLADLLSDPTIKGVAIATPAETHYAIAKAAMEAGKAVFVEKPLALDLAEAEALAEQAERLGSVLMVGHLLQYHPAFLAIKDIVRKGDLGRVQYVYSNRLNLGKVRREENILWSFAPHDISMILSLMGGEPESVLCSGAAFLHNVIADVTTTHMDFPGGAQAHIFVSWLHPFKEQKLVVVGEKGMAVFDDGEPWTGKLKLYPHHIDWIDGRPQPVKADPVPVKLDEAEPLKLECSHFLERIAKGDPARTDGAEGVRVLKVLHAADRSLKEGRTVRLAELAETQRFPAATIHPSSFVDEGAEIGPGSKVWHFSHVLSGVKIGRDCVISQNVMIGPKVIIGDRCKIQNNVSLYQGVTLEDGVFCGPSCVFTNVMNPRAEIERKAEFRPTLVKRGASIGANATIVCGSTLGEYCFIGAGAVVTKDVPAFALMAGVPARRIGWVSKAGEKLGADLICPRDGSRYRLEGNDRLVEIDK
jgi:UDP-2-acetamido-3-amino-2,3-dideoxy-glucuronate N-acetyltransferase